ncbi:type II toxin-antitoxin system HicA family toxin [Synergistes jonesii]|uniref:type II toxin-antitoxin system HicA family toxin n=1 Tax=Synergistes jonesii TaxID=2754 RepID=UPI00248E9F42|nr:type II toxin-antitoxin system HicA family toxin [Synergistes jonesii]
MKGYSSREVIRILKNDGWYEVRIEGSHHHFRHQTKKGTVTVPHPNKDLPQKTLKNIFAQAGIKEY